MYRRQLRPLEANNATHKVLEPAPAQQQQKPGSRGQVYSLLWRKKSNKLHKTWEGDAVGCLVADGSGTAQKLVVSADGLQLASVKLDPAKPGLEEGQVVSSGRYEFEIGSVTSPSEYSESKKAEGVASSAIARPPSATSILPTPKASTDAKKRGSALGLAPLPGHLGAPLQLDPFITLRPTAKRLKTNGSDGSSMELMLDPVIEARLRPHQADAVRFLFDCVVGKKHVYGNGAVLADEMGLGKSLTSIALIDALLKSKQIRNALIVCPVTLLANWRAEFRKWLPTTSQIGVMVVDQRGLGNGSLKDPVRAFFGDRMFKVHQVMIVGYERTRLLSTQLIDEDKQFDFVVCDEGHKLKTSGSKTAEAIAGIVSEKRVLLTGTPIQNNLNEFWALADFVNRGCLGSEAQFNRRFAQPIAGDPHAMNTGSEQMRDARESIEELSEICDAFMLRRDASVLSRYLSVPKTEYAVFCRPSQVQSQEYRELIAGSVSVLDCGDQGTCLQAITELKKSASGLTTNGGGKLQFLKELMKAVGKTNSEKLVIVSGSTKVLDLCQELCGALRVQWLRLDGQTPQERRHGMVEKFNKQPADSAFAFLLSSRSGGMGLNLVGGSHLVLVDCDWNPSIDAQAMARIHRDGQARECYIYRLFSTGTIDEKIFQRQLSKLGLSTSVLVEQAKAGAPQFTREQLRDLFTFSMPDQCNTLEALRGSEMLQGYDQPEVTGDAVLDAAVRAATNVSCVLRKKPAVVESQTQSK